VYCPNDYKAYYVFLEKVYDKIFDLLNKYPEAFVIIGGDFNVCMSENDKQLYSNMREDGSQINFPII
jgi:exonuclease III